MRRSARSNEVDGVKAVDRPNPEQRAEGAVEQQQANFEGWAIVEMFGHQREVGFVTTQAFGAAVLFRIETPELREREYLLERPQSVGNVWAQVGSKVKREAVPPRTKLVGPSAIYAMTPCTEATARMAIERLITPPLTLLELAKTKELLPGEPDDQPEDRVCEECGHTPEDGHAEHCSFFPDEDI
jgi:hypothetical protein